MAFGKDHPYHWIGQAIENKGGLHRALNIPAGQKIPEKRLEQAEHSRSPKERKEAELAETLEHMHGK